MELFFKKCTCVEMESPLSAHRVCKILTSASGGSQSGPNIPSRCAWRIQTYWEILPYNLLILEDQSHFTWTTLVLSRQSTQFVRTTPFCRLTTSPKTQMFRFPKRESTSFIHPTESDPVQFVFYRGNESRNSVETEPPAVVMQVKRDECQILGIVLHSVLEIVISWGKMGYGTSI